MSIRTAGDESKYFEVSSVQSGSPAWKKDVYRFWKLGAINGKDPMSAGEGDFANLWEQVSQGDQPFSMTFVVKN